MRDINKEEVFIDKIKSDYANSHEVWFNRWFERVNLKKRIENSAKSGNSTLTISITNYKNEYTRKRLDNETTIKLLKQNLEGFKIEYVIEKGVILTREYKSIVIDWSDN